MALPDAAPKIFPFLVMLMQCKKKLIILLGLRSPTRRSGQPCKQNPVGKDAGDQEKACAYIKEWWSGGFGAGEIPH